MNLRRHLSPPSVEANLEYEVKRKLGMKRSKGMHPSSAQHVLSVNYRQDKHNLDLLRRVVAVEALPASWRDYFFERRMTAGGQATA